MTDEADGDGAADLALVDVFFLLCAGFGVSRGGHIMVILLWDVVRQSYVNVQRFCPVRSVLSSLSGFQNVHLAGSGNAWRLRLAGQTPEDNQQLLMGMGISVSSPTSITINCYQQPLPKDWRRY